MNSERKKLVSLKVWMADASEDASCEKSIIDHLCKYSPEQLGAGAIPKILDEFLGKGHNGTHVCHVTALRGTRFEVFDTVGDEDQSFLRLRPDKARKSLHSPAKILGLIHDAGFVHNGEHCSL